MVMAAEGDGAAGLLLLLMVIGAISGAGLVGYGVTQLARHGTGPSRAHRTLRGLAALSGATAVLLYAWGALHLVGAVATSEDGGTSSAPNPACLEADGAERAAGSTGYGVSFVPLGFTCHRADGGSFGADAVPGYVNPAVLGLSAIAVVLAGLASESRDRSRARRTAEGSGTGR